MRRPRAPAEPPRQAELFPEVRPAEQTLDVEKIREVAKDLDWRPVLTPSTCIPEPPLPRRDERPPVRRLEPGFQSLADFSLAAFAEAGDSPAEVVVEKSRVPGRRLRPSEAVEVEVAAAEVAAGVRERVVAAARRVVAGGGRLMTRGWGVYHFGRKWVFTKVPALPERACACPLGALLIAENPPAATFASPTATAAELLGLTDRDVAAFVEGVDFDREKWSADDYRWNAFVMAGATAARELGLR